MQSITNYTYAIEAIGFVGLAFTIASFQGTSRKEILKKQVISAFFFIIHFYLLSTFTAMFLNILIVLRNIIFEENDILTVEVNNVWLYLFIFFPIGILMLNFKSFLDILPIAGYTIGTFARCNSLPSKIRIYSLLSASLWIPYNFTIKSYAGVCNQIIIIVSILFAIYKLDK